MIQAVRAALAALKRVVIQIVGPKKPPPQK